MDKKQKRKRRHPWIIRHFAKLGFTNRLAIGILAMIFLGLIGGFYLALRSMELNYTGQLLCWTVVFTPVGTASSVVLARVVDKNRAENVNDKTGISFAAAEANNFAPYQEDILNQGDAPTI